MFSLWLALWAGSMAPAADESSAARLLNVGELITADDYPLASLRKEEQGDVTVRVRVDEAGTVTSCKVVKSSGHTALDEQTCALFRARATFAPQRDRSGHAISSNYTQTIHWRLAGEKSEPMPRQAWMLRTTLSLNKNGQIADCKVEATGLASPPPGCATLLAIARAATGAAPDGAQIQAYAISEVYFYPVPVEKAPNPPGLSDAREGGREVASLTIAPDGTVTACQGVRYTGAASPERDACRTMSLGRFIPDASTAELHGTVVMIGYLRTQSIT